MRLDRLTTLLVASLAPTGRTGGHARGRTSHRPTLNTAAGGDVGGGTGAQNTSGSKDGPHGGAGGDGGTEERRFTQEDLDRIVTREKGKAAKEAAEYKARLDAIEAEKTQAAEKGKADADASGEAARWKRDLERAAKERDDAKALATTERSSRHALLIESAVTRSLVNLSFVGDDAAELVESRLRGYMKIEQEGDREVVYLVDGKDEIPTTDREKVAAWIRKRWPSQLKAQGGTGAHHGRGTGGGADDTSHLTPAQKIARSQQKSH